MASNKYLSTGSSVSVREYVHIGEDSTDALDQRLFDKRNVSSQRRTSVQKVNKIPGQPKGVISAEREDT